MQDGPAGHRQEARQENLKPVLSVMVFWRYVGWNTLLYLSGLQTIPKDLYEAATMDGATSKQQFWYITLPLLRPMMFYAVTLSVIGGLQLFEEPFIAFGASGGGEDGAFTSALYVFTEAFNNGFAGTSAAASWILFGIIFVLTIINNLFFAKSGLKDAE